MASGGSYGFFTSPCHLCCCLLRHRLLTSVVASSEQLTTFSPAVVVIVCSSSRDIGFALSVFTMLFILTTLFLIPASVFSLQRSTVRMSFNTEAITSRFTFLPSLPLCLEDASKSTTFDDPTAGMSEEQIANYVSNVGGGLCGSNEFVKALIGVSLNLSLIVFGILTVSYGKNILTSLFHFHNVS